MLRKYKGALLLLASAALGSLFPIIGKLIGSTVPPLFLAGCSVLISTIPAGLVLLYQRHLNITGLRRHGRWLALNSLFNIILPYACFFIGLQLTTGLHAALLLLAEIPFTVALTPLFGEPTTRTKVIGSSLVVLGAAGIVWNGGFGLNVGDLLIIVSTAFYPFGNFFGKKALNHLSPALMTGGRACLGGLALLGMSLFFESGQLDNFTPNTWWLIAINGIAVLGIGKLFWFAGFKTMDISKAVALVETQPLFSLILVALVLHESIVWYQWIGAVVMMLGVYVTLQRISVPHEQTRYAP